MSLNLEVESNDFKSRISIGCNLYKLGRYEEAIVSFDKALEIKSDDLNSWVIRGDSLYKLERYEEAIASFDKALKIKSDNDDFIWSMRGKSLYAD